MTRWRIFKVVLVVMIVVGAMGQGGEAAQETATVGVTTRVSVASDGMQGNGGSYRPSISADGRYIAFYSIASNLVPEDTNGAWDIFVHDGQMGTTTRVSVASDGTEGNGNSYFLSSISANGRYVAFESTASNLVPGDNDWSSDIFLHDRMTGTTTRVSVASDGTEGDSHSWSPSISADGRYVAFSSWATNLVPGDTNYRLDVFIHDRQTGITSRVSVASDGSEGDFHSVDPSISADGRYVAFSSEASTLVPWDTNGANDVYMHDRQTGITSRVSVASDGTQGNDASWEPSISGDGRYVAFTSLASNLVPEDTNGAWDIFVHDRQTGITSRVSVASDGTEGINGSYLPSITADGRYVAFESSAYNLVPGATNWSSYIFVHDLLTQTTSRVSVASDGTVGNGTSYKPSISADGRYVAFDSNATNLVTGDTNDNVDVFVHDMGTGSEQYAIQGRATDPNGGISDVVMSVGGGRSATTNSGGYYTIWIPASGTYMVTAEKAGYIFTPEARTVSVPPNAVGVDFMGSESGDRQTWTIMYYIAADNKDIEQEMYNELVDIARNRDAGTANKTVLFDPLEAQSRYLGYSPGQDILFIGLGEVNTGHQDTLRDFILWGKQVYPGTNYALVIIDHGHGLSGAANDQQSGNDVLTPKELRTAISDAGGVDVLYMHTCLMATIEMGYQLRDIVSYYVASESISWAPLNHGDYLSRVSNTTTPRSLAVEMAQSNFFQFSGKVPSTISVVDISKVRNTVEKTFALAGVIRENIWQVGHLVWLLLDSDHLLRFEESGDCHQTNSDKLADLYHFASLMYYSELEILEPAASDLLEALEEYVIFNEAWGGPVPKNDNCEWDHFHANGVSVALPYTNLISFYKGDWLDFADGTTWDLHTLSAMGKSEVTSEWGQMLVELIAQNNPDAIDLPEPPAVYPMGTYLDYIFLPILMAGGMGN